MCYVEANVVGLRFSGTDSVLTFLVALEVPVNQILLYLWLLANSLTMFALSILDK